MQPSLFPPPKEPYVCSPLPEPLPAYYEGIDDWEEHSEVVGYLLDKGVFVMKAPPVRLGGKGGFLLGDHLGDACVREEVVHFGHLVAKAVELGYLRYRKTKEFKDRMKQLQKNRFEEQYGGSW